MNDKIWTSFQEQQPNEAGPYWWRLKSAKLEGATLIFVAHMRMRGTCDEPILSPRFDHWTGWRVQVPECEWSRYDGEPTDKIEYEHLSVEGLSLTPCPFCGKTPKLKAWQACSGGGFIIGPYPQNYNLWKLECCAWGSSPDGKDPRQLEQIRRDAFLRIAASHIKPLKDALAYAKECEQVLVEALESAAVYIGDESAGSTDFWDKYRAALDSVKEVQKEAQNVE